MSVKLRVKKYKSGTSSYYLDVYQNGNRHAEFLGLSFKDRDTKDFKKEQQELAESIKAKRQLELQATEYGFIPKHKRRANFNDYYQTFIHSYKKNDVRMFYCAYEKFSEFTQYRRLSAYQITYNLLSDFKEFLTTEAGLSGETPQNYFIRFKRVLNKAYREGLINPMEYDKIKTLSIKRKANRALRKEILTIDEIRALKHTPCGNEEVKKAFIFACFTGLGEAEIRKLTWDRIQKGKLRIFREKTEEPIYNDLPQAALDQIKEQPQDRKYIFKLPSDVAVGKCLKNWVKRAKIQKSISFYCGRHSFAVILLKNGTNLKTVADLMGHADTTHTVKYLNYVDDLKEEAVNRIPSI